VGEGIERFKSFNVRSTSRNIYILPSLEVLQMAEPDAFIPFSNKSFDLSKLGSIQACPSLILSFSPAISLLFPSALSSFAFLTLSTSFHTA